MSARGSRSAVDGPRHRRASLTTRRLRPGQQLYSAGWTGGGSRSLYSVHAQVRVRTHQRTHAHTQSNQLQDISVRLSECTSACIFYHFVPPSISPTLPSSFFLPSLLPCHSPSTLSTYKLQLHINYSYIYTTATYKLQLYIIFAIELTPTNSLLCSCSRPIR